MPETPLEDQGDLFPRLSLESLELRLERTRRRLRSLNPQLTSKDFLELLGEIALLERKLDSIETWSRLSIGFPRRCAPADSAPTWALEAAQRLPAARWRRGATRRSRTSGTE